MSVGLAVALQVVKAAGTKPPRLVQIYRRLAAFAFALPTSSHRHSRPDRESRVIRPWRIRLCRESAKIRTDNGPIVTWAYCLDPTPPPYNGVCPSSSQSLYPPPKGTAESFPSYQSNRHGFLIVSIKMPYL